MSKRHADKQPTLTALVVQALGRLDDFATAAQLRAAIGTENNLSSTLHWLKQNGVVDSMESDGQLWFYLTGDDKRTRSFEERAKEEPGTRARKRKED